jgi:hypothetical protein
MIKWTVETRKLSELKAYEKNPPPSTSAQNWRVAGVDNTGASGLWCELVK